MPNRTAVGSSVFVFWTSEIARAVHVSDDPLVKGLLDVERPRPTKGGMKQYLDVMGVHSSSNSPAVPYSDHRSICSAEDQKKCALECNPLCCVLYMLCVPSVHPLHAFFLCFSFRAVFDASFLSAPFVPPMPSRVLLVSPCALTVCLLSACVPPFCLLCTLCVPSIFFLHNFRAKWADHGSCGSFWNPPPP